MNKLKRYIITMVFIVFSTGAIAQEQYYEEVEVRYIRAYDGDTIYVDIMGYPDIIGKQIPIRLRGIDTPEIHGSCDYEKRQGLVAKLFVDEILRNAKHISLTHIQRGKYFRIVANVIADTQNISDLLIEKRLAVPYEENKTPHSWCSSE